MNTMASLLVAKDIQQRRHAEATQDRRGDDPSRFETNFSGVRWFARLQSSVSQRRWLAGRADF
jgi:hypothetical protein